MAPDESEDECNDDGGGRWSSGLRNYEDFYGEFKVILASTSDQFSWHRKRLNKQKHSHCLSTSNQAYCMWSVLGYDINL